MSAARVFVIQDNGKNLSQLLPISREIRQITHKDFPIFIDGAEAHVDRIRSVLADYDPAVDYIVLMGDPVNIGLVMSIVINEKGGGTFLKWDRQTKSYINIHIDQQLLGETTNEKSDQEDC